MKKDFPFFIAFFIALGLHFLAGFALKKGGLFAAVPATPPAAQSPLSLRFVEVPPNATSVPEAPRTSNLSDANRKAGPLQPNGPKREVVQQPSIRPGPRTKSPGPARQPGPPATPAPQQRQAPSDAPQKPEPIGSAGPSIGAAPQLSQSLEQLDRFIQGTPGKPGGGGSGGGDGGNLPTGDPGSGVFFDTQGYDLWTLGESCRGNCAQQLDHTGRGRIGDERHGFRFIQNRTRWHDSRSGIVSGSGVPSFDQAAVRALQSSSPLPSLPADFPRDLLPGVFRFYYNMPVPQ